jgi:hypothetical protein
MRYELAIGNGDTKQLAGAKQVAEKDLIPTGYCEKHTSGPEGPLD